MMNPDELRVIDGLQASVEGLRDEVRAERRTRRWQSIAVVALIVFGAVVNGILLLTVRDQADELADRQHADCERTNAARSAMLEVTDVIPAAVLGAIAAVTGETPDERARLDRLAAEATRIAEERTRPQRAALAPRDCTMVD